MQLPLLGLGTYRLKDDIAIQSVQTALDVGFRAIDTAQIYENEAAIGQAIKSSSIPRDEIFLTTKVWVSNFSEEKFIPSLKESLHKLQVDAVNLTLLHWPAPKQGFSVAEISQLLLEAKQQGLTEQIGISNFTIAQTQEVIQTIGIEHIATNQFELSPYLQNQKLADYLQNQHIRVTSYMTLAYGKVLNDPILNEIAQAHQASSAQIALAWAMQKGYAVIPSSTKRKNLIQNVKAQHIQLSDEEMQRIASLERNGREINPDDLAPEWD